MKTPLLLLLVVGIFLFPAAGGEPPADRLEQGFITPPDGARPWVYWFWLNGNITREGITADLEAMKGAGIGGVIIMEVDQGVPVGPVGFMSEEWRALFEHAVREAERLGLEIDMNDDAGWNGSGGPWIEPERSMKEVVWTETVVTGPGHREVRPARPETRAGFFRDIAVQAFPSVGGFRIPGMAAKGSFQHWRGQAPGGAGPGPGDVIERGKILDLTERMDGEGRLAWDVPPGTWTVVRMGYTSTGVQNAPAPATGRGLECDKLDPSGIEAHFAAMMAKLAADTGAKAGGRAAGLTATHIDSWENGRQNWTGRMGEAFQARRGYDPTPFLPVLTGRVVESLEVSERFLWDLRRTVSDLVLEHYAARFRDLAHEAGLRFTVEAYGSPCDYIPYGGRADEPMGEFWTPGGWRMDSCRGMASAGHVYGKTVIGAEAFTADAHERWLEHPAVLKPLGDRAFCEGINRFVIHRYALQPWRHVRPGMTMGPWGQHYERTQTWWEASRPWHTYLARCQYLLRRGHYVADICYVQPEAPPQGFGRHPRAGYGWDECPAEVVMDRMSVEDGRLVLPGGMRYRVLALPETRTMTPALLRRIEALVSTGATVVGPRPERSPSLSGYPACDVEVKRLAEALWGEGRIDPGKTPEAKLAELGVPPDFSAGGTLRFIHRRAGDTEIYFVANPLPRRVDAAAAFRVNAKRPELWHPETGRIEPAPVFEEGEGVTRVALSLDAHGSVFVVFRPGPGVEDPVTTLKRNGKTVCSTRARPPRITVTKAVYGVLEDPKRTRDVRGRVQTLVDAGELTFRVARLAEGDDPAYGIVKTVIVDYTVEGKHYTATGKDPETLTLVPGAGTEPPGRLFLDAEGRLVLEARRAGRYEIETASGRTRTVEVASPPSPLAIPGPWEAAFDPGLGGPKHATFKKLEDWTLRPEEGIRYYSGAATYTTTFQVPGDAVRDRSLGITLDLGRVEVMAEVTLNGTKLGILWKPPFRVDVTSALRPGANRLEVTVINLWVNRMIGDEHLPEDSPRNPNGTLKAWPSWVLEGKPSPTGRITFTTWRRWKKEDPLQPSGLLGPVKVRFTRRAAF